MDPLVWDADSKQSPEPQSLGASWGLFSLGPHPSPFLLPSGRTGQTDETLPQHKLLLK